MTPYDTLRSWLPHLLLLAVLALAFWLMALVFAPVRDPVLLGGFLAVLTYPVLFDPCHRLCRRLLPGLGEGWHRRISALAAVVLLCVLLAAPLLLLLIASLGNLDEALRLGIGLAVHDRQQIALVVDRLAAQVQSLLAVYPALPVSVEDARAFLTQLLSQSSPGPAILGFLFKGTGLIAELTLAIITAFYCFEGGPLLVRIVLDHSPLDPALRQTLLDRFRRTILGLLADSIGTAILRGAVMGLLAWIIAGFNPILIGIVATFISLLPVVGIAFVWIPLASLLWAQDAHLAAVCLGLASIASDWLVQRAGRRLSRAMSPRGLWMSFLLFLGLVGGLLAFGVKGFVFGPMTVVLTAFLLEVWLPLYGMGQPAHEQKPPPAPPPA